MSSNPGTSSAAWFLGPRRDTLAILVAGPAISLALLWGIWHGPAFLIGAALFALFLDLPHVLHTYIRLLADPADFQAHRRPFWWGLAVITVLCIGSAAIGQFALLVSIWVYWQPYHVCKQHFGVATLYARKAGYRAETTHVKALVLSGFAAPIMYRLTHGGFHFGHYVLLGNTLPFSDLMVYTPPMPHWMPWLAYAVFAACTMHFLQREWQGAKRGETLPRFVWVMLAVSLALYNAAYLLVSDLYALILIGTSVHAIQYHLVCVSTVLAILPRAKTPSDAPFTLRWLHTRVQGFGRHPAYWGGALFVASLLVLATEFPSLGVVPLILVLHHFYLDGVIWKRKPR